MNNNSFDSALSMLQKKHIKSLKRNFNPDFGVTVCNHIFTGASPVLFVVRDEEKSWQFFCGADLKNDTCHQCLH